MIRLLDGPVQGAYLVKRAPLYLRAVRDKRTGKKDVLDQLDDSPSEFEEISVYRKEGVEMENLSVGRIVQYVLSAQNAEDINRRRVERALFIIISSVSAPRRHSNSCQTAWLASIRPLSGTAKTTTKASHVANLWPQPRGVDMLLRLTFGAEIR